MIREIVVHGPDKARRVFIHVSSMALADLKEYARRYNRELIFHHQSGNDEEIPLKIEHIDDEWANWLVDQGLLFRKDPEQENYEYWHKLYLVEIK